MKSPLVENLATEILERWVDCETSKDVNVLRLALLRELFRALHTEKSRLLASGLKSEAKELKEWEKRSERLRESSSLNGNLFQLLENPDTHRKKSRILPESLFRLIDREKFFRFDRNWEATIAAEAFFRQWKLWKLEAWIEISQVVEWDKALNQRLWPHGITLFTENAETQPQTDSEDQDAAIWKGRWIVVLHPRFKDPAELPLNIEQLPGNPKQAPSPFKWTSIYP